MEDTNTQPSAPEQPNPQAGSAARGIKTLQPTAQSQTINREDIAPRPSQAIDTKTLYPEATQSISANQTRPILPGVAAVEDTAAVKKSRAIILAVRIISGLSILIVLLSVLYSLLLIKSGLPATTLAVSIIVSIFGLLIAVGLFLLNELARMIQVILIVISLVLSIPGMALILVRAPSATFLVPYLIYYGIIIAYLIFLTRPSVKRVFS